MTRNTQREKIKDYLWARFGQWVPLHEILALGIAQYSARIFELRRELRPRGYVIENRKERQPDGSTHSWFKLDYSAAKPAPQSGRASRISWFEKTFGKPSSAKPEQAEESADLPLFAGVRR